MGSLVAPHTLKLAAVLLVFLSQGGNEGGLAVSTEIRTRDKREVGMSISLSCPLQITVLADLRQNANTVVSSAL